MAKVSKEAEERAELEKRAESLVSDGLSNKKLQAYIKAGEAAIDAAQTPGEIFRIQRMLRLKLRALRGLDQMS